MDKKYILREIQEQPAIWAEVISITTRLQGELKAILSQADGIILAGCGSALNVSFTAAPILQRYTGTDARAIPSADIFQFPEACIPRGRKPLVIVISRSGETTETVFAQRTAKELGCPTISINCFESTMSQEADVPLILTCCQERSICTTNSVTGMVLALQLLAAMDDKAFRSELERLPEVGSHVMRQAMELGQRLGEDDRIRKFAFIGSGPFYGIARECQLKAKEMTLLPSDSYPVMEYRHGPKSNVDEGMLVTMLCSDSGHLWERECADELMQYGGQLLVMADYPFTGRHTSEFCLSSGLSDFARVPLYLPLVQTMATYKSLCLGRDPNVPKHLSYWVETKVG